MASRRSSAWPLAAAWVALIVYASLHPFTGWVLPQTFDPSWLLPPVPVPKGASRFDLSSNLLAYMPLGALVAAGGLRDGRSRRFALLTALAAGIALSWLMETTQHLLPQRVPSIIDWAVNSAGTALGAAFALYVHSAGGLDGWQRWRERWLRHPSGPGVTLLLLWPVGLLFPPPLPFALGRVLARLRGGLDEALAGTAWDGLVGPPAESVAALAPGVELLGVAAGLLAPCLLAYSLAHPGTRRILLALGAAALGLGTTTLSTALNFGPDHAMAWLSPRVLPAVGMALGLAMLLAWVPARSAAACALLATAVALVIANLAPGDSYFDASLQGWEQGRFIRFHGVAQWVGWLWPWAALAYLLGRIGARDA